jgi:hypothetical protein
LAVALLLASATLYWDAKRDQPGGVWQAVLGGRPTPRPGGVTTPLLTIDPAAVVAVALERDGRVLHTSRSADGWSGVMHAAAVDDFLRELGEQAEIMHIESFAPDELIAHGLDPPQATVELQRRGQPPIVVLIGKRNPAGTAIYVRLGARGPIALTGSLLLWNLNELERALGAD